MFNDLEFLAKNAKGFSSPGETTPIGSNEHPSIPVLPVKVVLLLE